MTTVLDASVVVKCLVREDGSEEAIAALASADGLVAPDLLLAEACNVAWKKVRRGEIGPEHAMRLIRTVSTWFDRLVPSSDLAVRALEISLGLDHPAYDAMYLALAESEDAVLVTDDARLFARTRGTVWDGRIRALRPSATQF